MRSEWFVDGLPSPQGSKKGFINPKTGRVIITESAGKRLKDWRKAVWRESRKMPHHEGAVTVGLGFYMRRPRADFSSDGGVKASAPELHVKQPDIDKLTRSVLDALTDAKVILDDRYVVELHANKWWADDDQTGVRIIVEDV